MAMDASEMVQLSKLLDKYIDITSKTTLQPTELTTGIAKRCGAIFWNDKKSKGNLHHNHTVFNDKNKKCYICKNRFTSPHKEYPGLCIVCGAINWNKRSYKKDMSGKVALVTGGRIKIGFYVVLSLLRNGAKVITTTRFADDALKRFTKEKDFGEWKDRLDIIQTSLHEVDSIVKLVNYVNKNYDKLDVLIHNAAQTLRRPAAFYEHLRTEQIDYHDNVKGKLDNFFDTNVQITDQAIEYDDIATYKKLKSKEEIIVVHDKKSVIKYGNKDIALHDDETVDQYNAEYFPKGVVDEHDQQVDLRPINTWIRTIEMTNMFEFIEIFVVNMLAPFILTQQFIPLLHKTTKGYHSWVVNVSSMEGCFDMKTKQPFHPHTNMAKAGLNMMTRTCGQDLIKKNIVLVSVDTGWNTIEQPNSYDKQSPIDCVDGAARILDPIYTKNTTYGVFYKDFKIRNW
jgi:NAD(P)-dependent dehydrogenase (short-subunit alcohol dehydrogenase family)